MAYDEGNEEEAEENDSLPIIDYDISEDELDDYSRKPSPDDIPVKLLIFVRMLQGLVEGLIIVSMSFSRLDFFFVICCPPSKSLTQMIMCLS